MVSFFIMVLTHQKIVSGMACRVYVSIIVVSEGQACLHHW